MKGKILIVLFSLMLVFGMLAASCDNGAAVEDPTKDKHTGDSQEYQLEFGGPQVAPTPEPATF